MPRILATGLVEGESLQGDTCRLYRQMLDDGLATLGLTPGASWTKLTNNQTPV